MTDTHTDSQAHTPGPTHMLPSLAEAHSVFSLASTEGSAGALSHDCHMSPTYCFCSHFTDKDTEAQKSSPGPRLCSQDSGEQGDAQDCD